MPQARTEVLWWYRHAEAAALQDRPATPRLELTPRNRILQTCSTVRLGGTSAPSLPARRPSRSRAHDAYAFDVSGLGTGEKERLGRYSDQVPNARAQMRRLQWRRPLLPD